MVTYEMDLNFIANKMNTVWFAHQTVLITGAKGFFGSWMVDALKGCCNLLLANRDNFDKILKVSRPDIIYHFAPADIEPVIECAQRSNATLVYASSGGVYGGIETKCKEFIAAIPKTDYGWRKLRDEFFIRSAGIDYRIARLFTFCGTGMKYHFAITKFVNAVRDNKSLMVLGGGKSIRTYMYIVDAIVWLLDITAYGANDIYNVGSEREISIKELAKTVSNFIIPHQPIVYDQREFIDPAPYYVPDCSKARALGLAQWHDLEYGIRRMIDA